MREGGMQDPGVADPFRGHIMLLTKNSRVSPAAEISPINPTLLPAISSHQSAHNTTVLYILEKASEFS